MANGSEIRQELEKAIAFQKKWRRVTSFSYFAGASLSVVSAIVATVVAGAGYSAAAAIAAAIATMFTSLEKVLLFREKWSHHRNIEVHLEMVRLDNIAGLLDDKGTCQKLKEIMSTYAESVPTSNERQVQT